jgi:hypothetical protein
MAGVALALKKLFINKGFLLLFFNRTSVISGGGIFITGVARERLLKHADGIMLNLPLERGRPPEGPALPGLV